MKRNVPAFAVFAIVLWACTALLPVVRAQQGGSRSGLSDSDLQKMLDDMGFSPKKLSHGYLIVIKRDTWTISLQLTLSQDRTKLGMNANLGSIPKLDDITAAQWLALLEENEQIDPSAFYVDKSTQKLYIHRSLDNVAISPAFLRQQMDYFCDNIKSTEKAWAFTK